MTTSDAITPWTFEEGELPRWASPRGPKAPPAFDFGIGVPAVTPEPIWPLFGRIMLVRLGVALAFPAIVVLGSKLTQSGGVGEMLVGYCLVGFLVGAIIYFWMMKHRSNAQRLGPLHPGPLPAAPSVLVLFAWPVLLPAGLLAARVFYLVFENRFVGVALASLACMAVFYRFGGRPVLFMQELLLADVSVAPAERRMRGRFAGQPDLAKLATILLVVLLVPAYLSNAWAIVVVLILCGLDLQRSITPLLRFGSWPTVVAALWVRGCRLVAEDLDYAPHDLYHWRPQESLPLRRATLAGLLISLDFALLTGLAYYIPWEPFAALFVPDFKANFLAIPDYALDAYRWVLAPIRLADAAQPHAGYTICFVLAIMLYFIIPAVVLFLIYVERLAELENMAQELKRAK